MNSCGGSWRVKPAQPSNGPNGANGVLVAPDDFNWAGLAHGAVSKVGDAANLAWAEVAVRAYQVQAGLAKADEARHAAELAEMLVRANMIKRFVAIRGDPVLDGQL